MNQHFQLYLVSSRDIPAALVSVVCSPHRIDTFRLRYENRLTFVWQPAAWHLHSPKYQREATFMLSGAFFVFHYTRRRAASEINSACLTAVGKKDKLADTKSYASRNSTAIVRVRSSNFMAYLRYELLHVTNICIRSFLGIVCGATNYVVSANC